MDKIWSGSHPKKKGKEEKEKEKEAEEGVVKEVLNREWDESRVWITVSIQFHFVVILIITYYLLSLVSSDIQYYNYNTIA